MTHVTCRLTAKKYRDQLRIPTLGNRVRAAFLPRCTRIVSHTPLATREETLVPGDSPQVLPSITAATASCIACQHGPAVSILCCYSLHEANAAMSRHVHAIFMLSIAQSRLHAVRGGAHWRKYGWNLGDSRVGARDLIWGGVRGAWGVK